MTVCMNLAGETRWMSSHFFSSRRYLSPEMIYFACATRAASITWLSWGSEDMALTRMEGITISNVSLKRAMISSTCSGRRPNLERSKTSLASRSMSGEMKLIKTPRDASRRISRACPPNKTPEPGHSCHRRRSQVLPLRSANILDFLSNIGLGQTALGKLIPQGK